MADPKELAKLLEVHIIGTTEWRVANPQTGDYCMSFSRRDSMHPEAAAREWLRDHRQRFPGSPFYSYEVREVTYYSGLESVALSVIDYLNSIDCVPAPSYWCNKCGYRGQAQDHQRPNGTGECGYIARLVDPVRAEFEAWVKDRGCDTDGAWSAWQACWNLTLGVPGTMAKRFDDDWAPNPNDDLTPGADPTDRAGVDLPDGGGQKHG